jgi:hypothetical protein
MPYIVAQMSPEELASYKRSKYEVMAVGAAGVESFFKGLDTDNEVKYVALFVDCPIFALAPCQEEEAPESVVEPSRCPGCGADLSKPESVSREYISKDEEYENSHCLGHYDPKSGCFELDRSPAPPLVRHDLANDSDVCAVCRASL